MQHRCQLKCRKSATDRLFENQNRITLVGTSPLRLRHDSLNPQGLKTRLLLSLFFFIVSNSFGQITSPSPSDFYIGLGEDANLETARSDAYSNMVEQIQVIVSSSLSTTREENNAAFKETSRQSTLSSSLVVLRDVQENVSKNGDLYRVTKYVSKESVRSMFALRRQQIIDHCSEAETILRSTGKIDLQSAFDHYYKAWLLAWLYPDTLSYPFNNIGRSDVSTGIAQAMTAVANKVTFTPLKKIGDELTTWKYTANLSGQPISRLGYSFFDGLGESEEAVHEGNTQMTFLFNDKREREIPLRIEYRSSEGLDGILSIADSTRSGNAPVITVSAVLPGEKISKVSIAQKIPAPLQQLLDHRNSLSGFKESLDKISKRGDIIAGNKRDFDNLNGLYLVVLDSNGVVALLQHDGGKYFNIETGDEIRLPDFEGKKILWVRVQ